MCSPDAAVPDDGGSIGAGLRPGGRDPQTLQNSGIAKIDHWTDYVCRTGDAKSTASELMAAQADLKASFDLFMQRNDSAGASLSAIKIATTQRLLNQFRQAASLYQASIELAKRANRADYQTAALSNLAYSELQLGETDAAEEHAREAMRLGASCGNKSFYFEALDTAGEVEVKRGNLVAAGDYLDRALAFGSQVDDKRKLYLGYLDHADIYYQLATKCDYKRNFDVCRQSLELARTDYQKALSITQQLGYTYISQTVQTFLQDVDARKARIQTTQRSDEAVTSLAYFSPQKPKDVLVSERFTSGAIDPATLAPVESALNEVRAW
jgi:tetratricopeptide (TPR) repeat protein